MTRSARRALWLVWLCIACQPAQDPTETLVVVDADDLVRGAAMYLNASVRSDADNAVYFAKEMQQARFPQTLAIVPRGGDATRVVRVHIELLDADQQRLIDAQAVISFVRNEKRYHHVWLAAECIHKFECGPEFTCVAAKCARAYVAPDRLEKTDCSGRSCRAQHERVSTSEAGAAAPPPLECSNGELQCGGTCVDGLTNEKHCGACDHDCTAMPNVRQPVSCVDGQCALGPDACIEGHGNCNGDPTDGCEQELSVPEHCGACETDCRGENEKCVAQSGMHVCQSECPPDKPTTCGSSCVDLNKSPQHCGACDHACDPGMSCDAGNCKSICGPNELECGSKCIDPSRDSQNCGACGTKCGQGQVCRGSACVNCKLGQKCNTAPCQVGVTQCEPDPTCQSPAPVPDGTDCAAGGTCQVGHCSCGLSDGTTERFYLCDAEHRCKPGDACIDLGGNGAFFCKPLCDVEEDCTKLGFDWHCSVALCSNGRNSGIRVCNEQDSYLEPMHEVTACCGGVALGADGKPAPSTPVSEAGCADGTREAFTDVKKFPKIAGCSAKWHLTSMRAPRTGTACGDALGVECGAPADACAVGWHVCAAPPYGPTDVSNKVTVDQCAAQPGMFASAVGDRVCDACPGPDGAGFGAACCGMACTQGKADCLYPGATAWFNNLNFNRILRCGAIEAVYANQGVLCCRGF